ncbi:SWF/SNF family helicase [Streptococcus sp. DD10]|uniref:DEAD/DEAH box helicase n=1 Tax=Streptococcus sp. DD10 TaxID=1777878 RepID=UPI00079BD06E|nr:DEAD/DEAH box helicase [Streptococcus sp. DD10]KXT73541.1 SWF/SNF family helicase [Streptococcus sp. DD10]
MAKLMPGRIRNDGIALYDAGKVKVKEVKDCLLYTLVADEELRYSLDDEVIFCSCSFFKSKQYCAHLAAVEHFLKTDVSGKSLLEKMEKSENDNQMTQARVTFGSRFLSKILRSESTEIRFQLYVSGEEDALAGKIFWTLRLRRLPDEKSYIVRDIKAFLNTVKKGNHYSIGRGYYEPLYFREFDIASQDLITYLWGLTAESTEFILQNQNRHLFFPASIFEDGINRLQNLVEFEYRKGYSNYEQLHFHDFGETAALLEVTVLEHPTFFELEIEEKEYDWLYDGEFISYQNQFFQLTQEQIQLLKVIRKLDLESDGKKRIQFALTEQNKLAVAILQLQKVGQVTAPESLKIHDFTVEFNLDLARDGLVEIETTFVYEKFRVKNREELASLPFASNFQHEQQVFDNLRQHSFIGEFSAYRPPVSPKEIYSFFHNTIPSLERMGVTNISEQLMELYHLERPNVKVKTEGGLLSIGFEFSGIDQTEIDDALEALFQDEDFYVSKAGKVIIFDEESKKISQTLQELRAKKTKDGIVETNRIAAFQLSELFKNQENVTFSEEFRHLAYDLTHPEDFAIVKPEVKAELRDYQEIGVKWFSMLSHYGFGGILADDMGLGKTLQTISFLSNKLENGKRALIIAPSSLIYNWSDEFAKFAPQLDTVVSYGLKPTRDELIAEDHQVVITSYASFRQDIAEYERFQFDFLILDEAQVMKNAQTKIARYLRSFKVKETYALSGTPIENNLSEIWSIFEIVLPGLLPAKNQFIKIPADRVSRYIKPFVLRRKKEDVLTELPDLIEVVQRNELADSQKTIYLAQLKQMQERVRTASDEELNRNKMEILSGLMRLRQICDTPYLFMEDYDGESGKLESLRSLLEQIHAGSHRVLIFSQFRGMLDIIEKELEKLEMTSFKITGSTPAKERQDMTTAFNEGEGDAFLISLKAGGVGLNLTGADTVILVDLWWNPAVEAQAIGRAHRMGQEQNVEVYRLITRGTIEEKIQELQESKKNLISTVLDGTESRGSLSVNDIREILGLS